jgi:hypothetical protein
MLLTQSDAIEQQQTSTAAEGIHTGRASRRWVQ